VDATSPRCTRTEQPAGFGMRVNFASQRLSEEASAFSGRLLKFRLRRNSSKGPVARHAVPDQRFADGAASLLDGFLEISARVSSTTSKPQQSAGFRMRVEFASQQLREEGSAFPGRLLKFPLRRNNSQGPVFARHAVPDQRFADRAASLLDGFLEISARVSSTTSKPLC
jgi:hypothetical protein